MKVRVRERSKRGERGHASNGMCHDGRNFNKYCNDSSDIDTACHSQVDVNYAYRKRCNAMMTNSTGIDDPQNVLYKK